MLNAVKEYAAGSNIRSKWRSVYAFVFAMRIYHAYLLGPGQERYLDRFLVA